MSHCNFEHIITVPGVFIIELDLPHNWGVVPVAENNKWQAVVNVSPQLGDLFREILLFTVDHQQRSCRDTKGKNKPLVCYLLLSYKQATLINRQELQSINQIFFICCVFSLCSYRTDWHQSKWWELLAPQQSSPCSSGVGTCPWSLCECGPHS